MANDYKILLASFSEIKEAHFRALNRGQLNEAEHFRLIMVEKATQLIEFSKRNRRTDSANGGESARGDGSL